MNAIIITIGDELLIGQTIDTNSAWMGQHLNEMGVWVKERIAVSDDANQIIATLNTTIPRADLILLTGGLGPTKDDLTKNVLCEYFGGNLVRNDQVFKHVQEFFTRRGLPMLERNAEQAFVPDNCEVLFNEQGTAPGMLWKIDGKIIASLPGVPFEMKHLMQRFILPLISDLADTSVLHQTIITAGIGESFLAEKIIDWENKLPANCKLAYLPSLGMVKLRLTVRGKKSESLQEVLSTQMEALKTLVAAHLFADSDELPEITLGKLLLQTNSKICLAESCTGGYIASKLVSIAGSSAYFSGGIVCYSYEAKQSLLQVNKSILDNEGAVSESCVKAMCEGVLQKFDAKYAIAVSGIAGPDGGTIDKPVGTVWIAVGTKESIVAKKFIFTKDRWKNIELTYINALMLLKPFIN
jgi:nicotinamide-nucleotide amidase